MPCAIARDLAVLALVLATAQSGARAQPLPDARADEPRAFGYTVGDVVQRRVQLQLPPGTTLDLAALPQTRRPGQALELRSARLDDDVLVLSYQVFLAPAEVRTLEMPPLSLRFVGPAGERQVRVDAWPLTVAPLVPPAASPREGLGEMRPDVAAPAIATQPRQWRLTALATALLAVALGLLHLHVGLPWRNRRHRPFAQAWRALQALPDAPGSAPQALKLLHQALNRSAGEVLFAQGLPAFVARQPQFASLRARLADFFTQSQATFFAPETAPPVDLPALRALCRDCRDAERGGR